MRFKKRRILSQLAEARPLFVVAWQKAKGDALASPCARL